MFDTSWVYKHIPRVFGALAFIANPIFVYLIFTEKTAKLGNYRYVLLYFAVFNLIYSMANVAVPVDIHSYRHCFYIFISDGIFAQQSAWNLHVLSLRCTLVGSTYAVLLTHFLYRYLVIRDSSLTRENFHIYITVSAGIFFMYASVWYAICFYLGYADLEIKNYVKEDFGKIFGLDPMNVNMIGCLYNEGSKYKAIYAWTATALWTTIATVSVVIFLNIAHMIMKKLSKMADKMSRKTSKLQIELLRALIIQTVIPIFVSFLPCTFCYLSPILNIDLGRPMNYVEVIALGAFAFCDPVAIVICLPVFRKRVMCRETQSKQDRLPKSVETAVI